MKILKKLLKIYTQTKLAEMLGYSSRSTICNWVRMKKVPKNKLHALENLYNQATKN